MMLTTTDVVRLAHSRPWASKPWSAELLEVFPDRLERAVDRWRLSIERAHLEGAGLPVLEVRARLGSAAVPAVVKFDGAGSDLQQRSSTTPSSGSSCWSGSVPRCRGSSATRSPRAM